MHRMPTLSVLCLLFSGAVACAQSAAPAAGAGATSPKPTAALKEAQDLKTRTDAWFKDCKQGWDPGTHMSRRDYERTCMRMAQDRVKFTRDQEKTGRDRVKAK